MEIKYLIFCIGSLVGILGGLGVVYVSRRARDIVFFFLVFGTSITDSLDINLLSRRWYRGTSRGLEFSFVDLLALILLFGAVVGRIRGRQRAFWPASLGWLLMYLLCCGASVCYAEAGLFSVFELGKVVRGIVVFLAVAMYVRGERELRIMLWALCIAVGHEAIHALEQRYLFGMHRVCGAFEHANSLSMYCCIAAPVLAAAALSRASWLLRGVCAMCAALAGIAIVLSISRTGFATFAIVSLGVSVTCGLFRLTPRGIATAALVMVLAAGVVVKSWDTLQSRYGESSLKEEYAGKVTEGRGVYLRLAKLIVTDHFAGVGLNNWSYAVTNEYGPRIGMFYRPYRGVDERPSFSIPAGLDAAQAAPAHNLAALTAGELGWPGLIVLAALWCRWLQIGMSLMRNRASHLTSRVGVGVFFAIVAASLHSLTEWVFRHTPIYFLVHVLVATLAALYVELPRPKIRLGRRLLDTITGCHTRLSGKPQLRTPRRCTPDGGSPAASHQDGSAPD